MINTMKALIKREFWEHRGAFVKTPVIIGIVLIVITLGAYITALVITKKTGSDELFDAGVLELAHMSSDHLRLFWEMQVLSTSTLYFIVMFFILFFFLLGSLYDDRKDQSILFWKSLPISDSMTVISKILVATIFMPLIFIGFYVVFFLAEMIQFSIILLFHGLNPIKLVWMPMNYLGGLQLLVLGIITKMLWGLPVYGWLMFSSAISKRRPFLFAVLLPLLISVIWYWVNVLTFKFTNFGMFKEPLRYLGHTMMPYGSGSMSDNSFRFEIEPGSTIDMMSGNMMASFTEVEIIYGTIFFAVFFTLSIWVRRYRNTI